MPVFRPRKILVNFRLSEDEYERLQTSSVLQGARSVSDFARTAVLRAVSGDGVPEALKPAIPADSSVDVRLAQLDRKVNDLEARMSELVDLLRHLRRAHSQAVELSEGAIPAQ